MQRGWKLRVTMMEAGGSNGGSGWVVVTMVEDGGIDDGSGVSMVDTEDRDGEVESIATILEEGRDVGSKRYREDGSAWRAVYDEASF